MRWTGNGKTFSKNWNTTDQIQHRLKQTHRQEPTIAESVTKPIEFLDARPADDAGAPLLDNVLQTLQTLPGDGVLKLIALSQPELLSADLADRGFRINSAQWREDAWDVEIVGANTPEIADLRGMEAPEPMHHVLMAASQLDGDQTYFARLPHVPHPLFPFLEEQKLRWWVHEEMDQSVLLAVKASG